MTYVQPSHSKYEFTSHRQGPSQPESTRLSGSRQDATAIAARHVDDDVRQMLEAFDMLCYGRRLCVALSGGADSLTLLDSLVRLKAEWHPANQIEILPVHVDQYLRYERVAHLAREVKRRWTLDIRVIQSDTREVASGLLKAGKAPCRGCAPIRAKALSAAVAELNADALLLGHHLDDALATLLMNIFHGKTVTTMRPVTHRNGMNQPVLRPLLLTPEATVKAASPFGPQGLFACDVCTQHSSERARVAAFVAETQLLHPPTRAIARRNLAQMFRP